MAPTTALSRNEKLKRITLTQTLSLLESAQKVRTQARIIILEGMPLHTSIAQKFEKADKSYQQRLIITIYIARLYSGASYYSKDVNRVQRQLRLLKECIDAADDAFRQVNAIEHSYGGSANQRKLEVREHMCSSIECLRGCAESLEVLLCEAPVSVSIAGREKTLPDLKLPTFSPMLLSVSNYLKQTPIYDWNRQAPATLLDSHRNSLTEKEQAEIVIQRLNIPLQRLRTEGRPLFFDVERWSKSLSDDPRDSYDAVNAVWDSSQYLSLEPQRDINSYKSLRDTIKDRKSRQRGADRSPSHLARSLQSMNIDLGIVFQDEPDIVAWPFGRNNGDRFVLVCKGAMYYSAVRLLMDGKQLPQRPTVTSPPASEKQSVFPFLQLPSEVRNQIYEVYLQVTREWEPHFLNLPAELPPFCNANRQIRKELTPIFLASRTFTVRVDHHKTPEWNTNRLLMGRSSWLGCTKYAPYFKRILFRPDSDTHDYGLLELSASCSREGKGFRVTSRPERFFQTILKDYWPCFEAMINILVEDSETGLFTVSDMAALADFLCEYREKADRSSYGMMRVKPPLYRS